ncbi:MAG: glycosyltransferase family 1 protein [Chloroflexota bacterium]|nr:MAG: glycosyltransferase family 1 protein [Chloroflexota bacterium]
MARRADTLVTSHAESQVTHKSAKSAPRLRVLKIAPTSFFSDYGCHVRVYEETTALLDAGHQVTICTYHTGNDVPGLDIRRALNTPWHKTVRVGSSRRKIYYDVLLFAKALQTAAQIRPNIVHAHLHEGALIGHWISKLLRVPLVFDFQGSLTREMLDHNFLRRESIFFRPLQRLEQWTNGLPGLILTSSHNAADVLCNEFDCPRGRIYALSDCVNTARFRPVWESENAESRLRLREQLGIPPNRKIVVYLGLLAEYQGIGMLLEAATVLVAAKAPVHFLIMGFPGEEHYRAQARGMGLAEHTTFTGRIPYSDAPSYLQLGDVAVSPKVSETEGNGKLLNYMAVGLPTVAFDTPVAREILGDLGVYARLEDCQALAEAMGSLLSDPGLAADRGRRLRARAVEQFSWSRAGQRLLHAYDLVGAR